MPIHTHVHVTALGVLCCFALFVCLILLASFFLPSHLSFKNMYYVHCYIQPAVLGLSMLTGQANNKGQPSFRKPISLTNSPSPRPQDDTKLRKSQRMVETQANDFPSAIESSVLRVSSSTSMLLPSLSQSSETQLEKKGSKTVQNKRSENALVELSSTKVGVSAKGSKSNTEIGSRGKTIKQVPSSSSQPNISTCSSDGNEEESSRGAHGSGDTPHGTAARETAVRTRSDGMSFSLAVDVCNGKKCTLSIFS